MLALGELEKDPASREEGVGKSLFEWTKPVSPIFQISAESHPMRLPFSRHGVYIIHLNCNMLDTLAVSVNELANLGFHFLVSALHERDFGGTSLDNHGIHAGLVAADILRGPDDFESKNFCKQVLRGFQILDAQRD